MINFIRPLVAFSLIPLGILLSLSISFTNILGPPSTKINYDTSKKLSSRSTEVSSFQTIGGIKVNQAIDLAEEHVTKQKLIHDFSELDLNSNLSDPSNGMYTFLTVLCYGKSENNCSYRNAYITTKDSGITWEIGFL